MCCVSQTGCGLYGGRIESKRARARVEPGISTSLENELTTQKQQQLPSNARLITPTGIG